MSEEKKDENLLYSSSEVFSSNTSKLHHAKFSFNPNGYWDKPIETSKINTDFTNPNTAVSMLALFDQNGYDLTELEKVYANFNDDQYANHRTHRFAIKKPWYYQIPDAIEGPVINHCYLFERKGYSGAAKEQLESWAKGIENDEISIPPIPLYHKLLAMKPKWGIDFSMDYVDRSGNVFEIFHYEYDCFSATEAEEAKARLESVIENTDWNEAAKILLQRKEEWIHLPFFEQSDWKCAFFGLPSEKFKTVVWNT
jgi:hypothetical protein